MKMKTGSIVHWCSVALAVEILYAGLWCTFAIIFAAGPTGRDLAGAVSIMLGIVYAGGLFCLATLVYSLIQRKAGAFIGAVFAVILYFPTLYVGSFLGHAIAKVFSVSSNTRTLLCFFIPSLLILLFGLLWPNGRADENETHSNHQKQAIACPEAGQTQPDL